MAGVWVEECREISDPLVLCRVCKSHYSREKIDVETASTEGPA